MLVDILMFVWRSVECSWNKLHVDFQQIDTSNISNQIALWSDILKIQMYNYFYQTINFSIKFNFITDYYIHLEQDLPAKHTDYNNNKCTWIQN